MTELVLDPMGSLPLLDAVFAVNAPSTAAPAGPTFQEHLRVAEQRPDEEQTASVTAEREERDGDEEAPSSVASHEQTVAGPPPPAAAPAAVPIQSTPAAAAPASDVEVAEGPDSQDDAQTAAIEITAGGRRRVRGGKRDDAGAESAPGDEVGATEELQRVQGVRERRSAQKAHGGVPLSDGAPAAAAAAATAVQVAEVPVETTAEAADAIVATADDVHAVVRPTVEHVVRAKPQPELPANKPRGKGEGAAPVVSQHSATAAAETRNGSVNAVAEATAGVDGEPDASEESEAPRRKGDAASRRRVVQTPAPLADATSVAAASAGGPLDVQTVAGEEARKLTVGIGVQDGRGQTAADAPQPAVDKPAAARSAHADATPSVDGSPRARLPTGNGRQTLAANGSSNMEAEVDRVRFVQRVARAFHSLGEQEGQVRLRLSPPSLGSLHLEVTLRGGELTARLQTETAAAKNLLLDNLPLLRERLAEQDIKIARFDVDLMGQPDDRGTGRQTFEDSAPRQPLAPQRKAPVDRNASAAPSGNESRSRTVARQGSIDVLI